jgi:putative acetyltransferase
LKGHDFSRAANARKLKQALALWDVFTQRKIIRRVVSNPAPEIRIRAFQPGDEAAFRSLNTEWISNYFRIEPKDEQIFSDPQRSIIDKGGQILFATLGEECIACCALLRMDDKQFEVGKMAVSPNHQGLGIGRKLLKAVIDYAHGAGAERLYLETNHILTPAIRLYESLGFVHIDPALLTPSPYARSDVYMQLLLVN